VREPWARRKPETHLVGVGLAVGKVASDARVRNALKGGMASRGVDAVEPAAKDEGRER
jgi:hypothetical protein